MPVLTELENSLLTTPYDCSDGSTINTSDFSFSNFPHEVGYYSLFINTTETGEVAQTVSVYLQFKLDKDGDYYGVKHELKGDNGSSSDVNTFSTGSEFEAALQNQTWWKFNARAFKIVLEFAGGTTPNSTINYIGIHAK